MVAEWLMNVKNGSFCTAGPTKKNTMDTAKLIAFNLATTVECNEPRDDRLEPDLSFRHKRCLVADLVVEVAWSQSKLKLPDRARRFIEGNDGRIRTVVGLDLNDMYRGGRKATFSVWKAQLENGKWKRNAGVHHEVYWHPQVQFRLTGSNQNYV